MNVASDVAVITGAGSGIGAALAVELADRGLSVALIGRRRDALERTCASLPEGATGFVLPGDIAIRDDRQRLITKLGERLEPTGARLRYLVHNAGVGEPATGIEGIDPDDLAQALAVNVTAPLALTQGLLPLLRAAYPSRVLMVGAGIADRPQPGTGSYGISKKALARLFEQLTMEFARSAVTEPDVALFQPGLVDTPGIRTHLEAARRCGLPHVDYLDQALAAGQSRSAEAVAGAMAEALIDMSTEHFAGAVLRP
ncbi:SDR family oxidoreductase [Spiribacter aquaticus]|jgi:NAD(P)-dependent dehydrogenase (short-subunit alcohol dehydrogenase family)|uniref:SDR family oxidoreductase n=1 Tax=Spiribacter aquaticus TaxID=1935996 RepID=A0A557RFD9_9GAMM|nr:hypothetical protein BA897_06980 [Spiribacter roseus]TVO63849.1 SDR family oxidoreductase [Spiribacter aquaticus]